MEFEQDNNNNNNNNIGVGEMPRLGSLSSHGGANIMQLTSIQAG